MRGTGERRGRDFTVALSVVYAGAGPAFSPVNSVNRVLSHLRLVTIYTPSSRTTIRTKLATKHRRCLRN